MNSKITGTESPLASSTSAANNKQSDKQTAQDKYKMFENEGVVFKAKLIGSELVMEPRGDKMCQNSIQRLKAIIKGTNSHKRRIVLKISYSGVKVYDEKTNEILHHHEVPEISYIASDDTDTRTFGYVSDVPNKTHQFICFKTSGPAINVMSTISSLFEAVLERKNQTQNKQQSNNNNNNNDDNNSIKQTKSKKSNNNKNVQSSATKITEDVNIITTIDSIAYAIPTTDNVITPSATPNTSTDNVNAITDIVNNNNNDSGIMDLTANFSEWLPSPPRPIASASRNVKNVNNSINNSCPQTQNRFLIYNHSSVSLNDASLTRQSSFTSTATNPNDSSYTTDKYAVFNDIDNLPSIFESTSSLGSTNKLSRQTNPFDDDFFA